MTAPVGPFAPMESTVIDPVPIVPAVPLLAVRVTPFAALISDPVPALILPPVKADPVAVNVTVPDDPPAIINVLAPSVILPLPELVPLAISAKLPPLNVAFEAVAILPNVSVNLNNLPTPLPLPPFNVTVEPAGFLSVIVTEPF